MEESERRMTLLDATSKPTRPETADSAVLDLESVRAVLGLSDDVDVVAEASQLKARLSELAGENARLRALLRGLTGMELNV